MGFVSNFIRFRAVQEDFENPLRFDKVTESLKVGTFLRHGACVRSSVLLCLRRRKYIAYTHDHSGQRICLRRPKGGFRLCRSKRANACYIQHLEIRAKIINPIKKLNTDTACQLRMYRCSVGLGV